MISVLCVNENSVYKTLGLDCYDKQRDAYSFTGGNPVITHAPCQQWSRLKAFAKPNDYERDLAWFCLEAVERNGGIFEHPAGSSFFREAGIVPTISINQFWFGFPCRKHTWLYFSKCKPLALPLRFDAIEKKVDQLHSSKRSDTTESFAMWLIACIEK